MFIFLIRKSQKLSMINLESKACRLSNLQMLLCITTRQNKLKAFSTSWSEVFIWYILKWQQTPAAMNIGDKDFWLMTAILPNNDVFNDAIK